LKPVILRSHRRRRIPVSVREKIVTDSMIQFQRLEEKLTKMAEIFRQTQAENKSLLQQIEMLKAESKETSQRQNTLEHEIQALRREREEVRSRVERLLEQVEALTKQDSAG